MGVREGGIPIKTWYRILAALIRKVRKFPIHRLEAWLILEIKLVRKTEKRSTVS